MEPLAISVQVLPGYRLAVVFEDGTSGVVDCTPWVYERDTGLVAALRDPQLFAQVFVNEEFGTIEWPNGVDVAPETLYEKAHRSAVK
jgi:hypothetical protein